MLTKQLARRILLADKELYFQNALENQSGQIINIPIR